MHVTSIQIDGTCSQTFSWMRVYCCYLHFTTFEPSYLPEVKFQHCHNLKHKHFKLTVLVVLYIRHHLAIMLVVGLK